MSEYVKVISLSAAAKRLKIGQVEAATTWSARHNVPLVYDDSTGKPLGFDRQTFEQVASGGDSEVRDLLDGERRQERERERSLDDVQKHVRTMLEGERPATGSNNDRDRIPNLVGGDKSKVKPSKGDQLLGLIGTQNTSKSKPSEPGSKDDVEDVKRWLKL